MEAKYLNNQVAQIVGITNRQVISWTEKGLVIPYEESTGVGKKRIYDYVNLLEFAICDVLLNNVGIGFRSVKNLIKHLRDKGSLVAWASNFNEYFETQLNQIKEILKPSNFNDITLYKIQPQKSVGFFVYFVGIEFWEVYVIPWEIENTINLSIIKDNFAENLYSGIINIGKIKEILDKRI